MTNIRAYSLHVCVKWVRQGMVRLAFPRTRNSGPQSASVLLQPAHARDPKLFELEMKDDQKRSA